MSMPMKNAVVELASVSRVAEYLGPARVVAVRASEVDVMIDGARARARMALSVPYAAAIDDELLVIMRGDDAYVIGVLRGAGRTVLAFEGDVEVRARGGKLTLASDDGVSMEAPRVEIHAGKLETIAGAAITRLDSLYQRVRGALSTHAGRAHTVVDDVSFLTAKNASIVTEETMSINGDEVHLG